MTDEPEKPRERVIDKTADMEREWADREAERRATRWEKRKRGIDAERRERRAQMSDLELHRHLVERYGTLSTVAAGNVEPSRGGGDGVGPPKQQQLEDDWRWRETLTVVRSRLERAHELLDEAEGVGPVASTTTMIGEEKDKRIISDGEGLSPGAVVEKLGRDIAGSPETVRRVRKAAGRSTKDGYRIEASLDMPRPVRRVVIDP